MPAAEAAGSSLFLYNFRDVVRLKIALVLDTKPEIVKCSPIIRECIGLGLPFFVLHTGQHYSFLMDKVFFEQLALPKTDFNLDVGSGGHGRQTGLMLEGIERVLLSECPDVVLVQGDTNTVLAGAIAAAKESVNKRRDWVNPFGDGDSAQKIVNILKTQLS